MRTRTAALLENGSAKARSADAPPFPITPPLPGPRTTPFGNDRSRAQVCHSRPPIETFQGRPSACHSRPRWIHAGTSSSGNPGQGRQGDVCTRNDRRAPPLSITPPLRGSRRSRANRRRPMRWGGNVPLHRIGHSPAARCRPPKRKGGEHGPGESLAPASHDPTACPDKRGPVQLLVTPSKLQAGVHCVHRTPPSESWIPAPDSTIRGQA